MTLIPNIHLLSPRGLGSLVLNLLDLYSAILAGLYPSYPKKVIGHFTKSFNFNDNKNYSFQAFSRIIHFKSQQFNH